MTEKKWKPDEKAEIKADDQEGHEVTELEDDDLEGVSGGGVDADINYGCPTNYGCPPSSQIT